MPGWSNKKRQMDSDVTVEIPNVTLFTATKYPADYGFVKTGDPRH